LAWEVGFTEAEHYQMFLEGFEFGASAWLDRFDLVRRAGHEPAFPITGTGVLLLDDRRISKLHRQLRRGGLGKQSHSAND
jgi:hypothetical protein